MDQRHLLMHQAMLGDGLRLEAYDRALAQVIEAGCVVVDVGAGTLALTALALRHGADHVYAIEADPQLAEVASALVAANGWGDRVTLIEGDARLVRLPCQADVVVSEMIGNLGPEEDMSRILATVARRVLRPGGRVVPERLVSYLAPVEFGNEGWGLWRDGFLDMRLDVVQKFVQPEAHLHFFTVPPTLLGDPMVLADSAEPEPDRPGSGGRRNRRPERLPPVAVTRPGRLQAIVGYFVATLVPGVTLSNLPSYPGCNWAVWVWPLRHSDVEPGDAVRIDVCRPQGERIVTDWRLECQLLRRERV